MTFFLYVWLLVQFHLNQQRWIRMLFMGQLLVSLAWCMFSVSFSVLGNAANVNGVDSVFDSLKKKKGNQNNSSRVLMILTNSNTLTFRKILLVVLTANIYNRRSWFMSCCVYKKFQITELTIFCLSDIVSLFLFLIPRWEGWSVRWLLFKELNTKKLMHPMRKKGPLKRK